MSSTKKKNNRQRRRKARMRYALAEHSASLHVLLVLLAVIAYIVILNLLSLPVLKILSVTAAAVILYFTWIHPSKPPLPIRILAGLSAAKLAVYALLPLPRLLAVGTALLLMGYVLCAVLYLYRNRIFDLNYHFPALLGLEILIGGFFNADYTHLGASFPFALPALLLSVLLTAAVACILIFTRNSDWSDRSYRWSLLLLTFVISIFIFLPTLQNLNVALDTAPTTEAHAVVREKHTSRSGGKYKTTRYHLTVILNGREEKIDVSYSTYQKTEEGAYVTVIVGEGAFGVPYASIP